MAQADSINTLRRRRSALASRFAITKRQLDEYEESGQVNKNYLVACRQSFDEGWKKLSVVQDELEVLDEGEVARAASLLQDKLEIDIRLLDLFDKLPATTPSPTKTRDSCVKPEPTPIILPEVRAPLFDGTLENWTYFYDTFSSTVDRNENLTKVQKFQYLRSSITGRAARSIQSLELTEANYPIALTTLKEKFNCPLRICMRHWELMRNYPEIKRETPEAIKDLLQTISVNLKALEKLGQPVTSDVVLIELLATKLPSSSMRKWQRTLLNQEVPSYHRLMEFLKTRANRNQLLSKAKETKGSTPKHHRHRQNLPHGQTYTTTSRTLVCPTCDGPHKLRYCKVFKAKSAIERFQLVKMASLCTNCLGSGHSITQCTARSCHICGQRHHTYLHREQTQENSRSSSGRSSKSRSSGSCSSSSRSSSSCSSSSRSSDSRSSSGRSSGSRSSSGRSSGSRLSSGRSSGSRLSSGRSSGSRSSSSR